MNDWWDNKRRYNETYATWRKVEGGRALHAFYDGSDVPLCGIRPMRPDGQPSRWKERRGGRRHEHWICSALAQQEKDRRVRALIEQQREEMGTQ